MMDIQAAIGIHQLKRANDYWEKRKTIWQYYNQQSSSLPITLPADPEENTRLAYHLDNILIDEDQNEITRDKFLEIVSQNTIGVGGHYIII